MPSDGNAERILRDEREDAETLRLLLETAAQGILCVDRQGVIRSANPALAAMSGWSADDLVGRPLSTLIPRAVRDEHARHSTGFWASPRSRPMGRGLHLELLRRDGTHLPVEISLSHVHSGSGGRAFAFVTDISARQRAEATLEAYTGELERRAQQLRRLASELTLAEQRTREELAKGLHDHLQQLLFSARLRVDRLATRLEGGPDATLVSQARSDMDEAIASVRALATELFLPALHDEGLAAAFGWLAAWMRDKHGLAVDLQLDREAAIVNRDVRTFVFGAVRELLFNAVKHAGVDRASLTVTREPGALRVTVTDEGSGFDPATCMDPSRFRSTGLGLFSIRERAAIFGGRLDIDAAPGGGARLSLVVPMSPAALDAGAPGPAAV